MNALQQLQEDVAGLLLGNPETAVVPYTAFRKLVIESVQDEAQAAWKIRVDGKVGLACLVLMPSARMSTPNVPGPQFVGEVVVRTFEDPRVNNTGLSAEDVAVSNLKWLDGMLIEDLTELYGDVNGDAVRPVYDYPGLLVYDSVLVGQLPQDALARVAAPTIADDDAGTVTLACGDGQASIYYTTDGSVPNTADVAPVQNPDGTTTEPSTQIYTGPFAVVDGTVVRCLAWKAGALQSFVAKGTITIP